MDQKIVTILTLCDLSKAFNIVSHEVLLIKCTKLNIDNFWFNSYFHDRTQSVRLSDTLSNKLNVDYDVPQDSVLGPIILLRRACIQGSPSAASPSGYT